MARGGCSRMQGGYRRAGIGFPAAVYGFDLGRKLVTAPGDRADQVAIHTKSGAQRRDLPLEIIFLDDPVGQRALNQGRKRPNRTPAGASEAASIGPFQGELTEFRTF
jgi:hypothetical protein